MSRGFLHPPPAHSHLGATEEGGEAEAPLTWTAYLQCEQSHLGKITVDTAKGRWFNTTVPTASYDIVLIFQTPGLFCSPFGSCLCSPSHRMCCF